MARKCSTCGAELHTRHTGKGFRTFHPNGQSFCAAKSYPKPVSDMKYYGYQDRGEWQMSAAYANEVRHVPGPD